MAEQDVVIAEVRANPAWTYESYMVPALLLQGNGRAGGEDKG